MSDFFDRVGKETQAVFYCNRRNKWHEELAKRFGVTYWDCDAVITTNPEDKSENCAICDRWVRYCDCREPDYYNDGEDHVVCHRNGKCPRVTQ